MERGDQTYSSCTVYSNTRMFPKTEYISRINVLPDKSIDDSVSLIAFAHAHYAVAVLSCVCVEGKSKRRLLPKSYSL